MPETKKITMNDVLSKCPELGIEIFKDLNDQTLSQCRIVTNSWKKSIENEKFYWLRKLHSCDKYKQEVFTFSSKNFLEKVIKASNLFALKQIVNEAQNGIMEHTMAVLFSKAHFISSKEHFSKQIFDELKKVATKNDSNAYSPLHCAAEIGHLTICLLMLNKMKDKCPKTKLGCTPLHTAAYLGHSAVCRLLMGHSMDKNPKDSDLGRTPLHWAANNGHLRVCKLIIDNTEDKNPKTINGVTPLHLAARYGHFDICQLIIENISSVSLNNLPNGNGWTPLHTAAEFGQYRVVQLILKHVENKNPKNKKSNETTPMELAEFYGYSTIGLLIQNSIERQSETEEKRLRPS